MTTATLTVDPATIVDHGFDLISGIGAVITGTGPWTVTVSNTYSQASLDDYVASFTTAATEAINRAAILAKATAAVVANGTFLALASPTNAQVVAQVRLLTREATALIKVATAALADQTGT